ncbi:efflux RND transporter permease subunit [Veronia pacifica]|uniref:Acriflavin resistance protein n=1 Tax=Veronia pacifica TaxID=1080227 RepID=A0A1C3EQX6_9GAMM|nr:efflux RND transporter permease subunit [Veronia pacifica]ODA35599.1 acriflavin resistance protein [Veronia pacifica]
METNKEKGLIAYFANNSVAANLLMIFILIIGLISYFTIQRQMFPNIDLNYVSITASYPGASPQEIEDSILIKIEESLKDVTEIKKMTSRASRASGSLQLEINTDADLKEVLDKVKQKVDSISGFPSAMEPISVTQVELQQDVIELVLAGDRATEELKPIGKEIEKELLQLNNVSIVEFNAPSEEVAIEVEPDTLRKYNLTLNDVTTAIRRYSSNFSAGQVNTNNGLISVRIENQFYRGEEFAKIPVKLGPNGSKVLLRDIATIKDGFTEGDRYFNYSGQNAIYFSVKATASQNSITVADSVKKYIAQKEGELPRGLSLVPVVDMTYYLNGRLDMMLKNLLQGAILVAILLGIFLRLRLAMWVMVGLPVCFLGAIMFMPAFGVTINVLSLFAFIMVLGIVVDDAIVMGESAYTEIEKNGGGVDNVVRGVKRVATPATFGVLTSIAVFAPFMMASGPQGQFFASISVVVILCLTFSLIESKLILPAHLAHTRFSPVKENSFRAKFNRVFFGFVNGPYRRFVTACIKWRWTTFSVFVGLLLISAGLISSGNVRFVPSPKIPHDFPSIRVTMNDTVSSAQTLDVVKKLESIVSRVDKETEAETGKPMVDGVLSFTRGRNQGTLVVKLVDEELRPLDTFELARRWREQIPAMPGVKSLTIQDSLMGGGDSGDFGYMLFGSDIETLNSAGLDLIASLQRQKGLYDISSSIDTGSKELQLSLKPVAYDLGLDLSTVAQQVGGSFYGGEAQRLLRDGEEVRVMVRYPKADREALSALRYTVITVPNGSKVMLGDVANIVEKPGVSSIRREGGFRSVYVYGSIDDQVVEPGEVVKNIRENILPDLTAKFPSVKTELSGSVEEQQAEMDQQILFFIAGMIVVYILLAVPLKSYAQPLIIMSVIPFSLTGAIWGHYFFGIDMSTMSVFGLIAAAGVVINDSLVMTDYINKARASGLSVKESVIEAGCARFRAILLTSITTFAGVLPIMFETSLQARIIVPMAVALGFAVLFATFLSLTLVPCLYLMLKDIGDKFRGVGGVTKLFRKNTPKESVTV